MSKELPVIGISAHWDKNEDRYGVRRRYFASLIEAGAVPVLLPLGIEAGAVSELLARLDGVLLSGGEDVEPARYGQVRSDKCGAACEARDTMEAMIVAQCLERKLPLFGICRGMQAMNAFTGGTLIQDICSSVPDALEHVQTEEYHVPTHRVVSLGDPIFERVAGVTELMVNSRHHQSLARPGRDVHYLAKCPDDGVIESMVIAGHPYAFAVQWHPEMMAHLYAEHAQLFKSFVAAAKGELKIG